MANFELIKGEQPPIDIQIHTISTIEYALKKFYNQIEKDLKIKFKEHTGRELTEEYAKKLIVHRIHRSNALTESDIHEFCIHDTVLLTAKF